MPVKDELDGEVHRSKESQREIGTATDQGDHESVTPTASFHDNNPEGNSSSEEDSEDVEFLSSLPFLEVAVENTAQVIDRLYRLSFMIRNPAT